MEGNLPGSSTSLEFPRLTTFLRSYFSVTQKREAFDIHALQKQQIEILKQKRAKKPSKSVDTKGSMSWKHFATAEKASDSRLASEMHTLYNKFLKAVMDLVGDESSSEILHSSSYIIYTTLIDEKKQDATKKEELVALFGTISDKTISNMNEMVTQLEQWKNQHMTTQEKLKEKQIAEKLEGGGQIEFGEEIEFKYVSGKILQSDAVTQTTDVEIPTKAAPIKKTKKKSAGPTAAMPAIQARDDGPSSSSGSYWEDASRTSIGPNWLFDQCSAYLSFNHSEMTPQELSQSIYRAMRSSKSDAQLQDALFELVGESGFEFIILLMNKRIELLRLATSNAQSTAAPSPAARNATPNLVGSIVVQSEQDKLLKKLEKKDRQRKKGAMDDQTVIDFQEMKEHRQQQLTAPIQVGELMPAGSRVTTAANVFVLPENATRRQTKTYEEVSVPYTKPAPFAQDEKLVGIEEFEEFARVAFKGYKSLNRLQSKLFEAAYKSNENILACAPTGAGKTDVAMMTILREVGLHYSNGRLHREHFKIVYVAPMKALAAEVTEKFSRRLSPLGIICKELTGDMQLTKKELTETQIIVTTPEKWDVITRKSGDVALTSMVRLLIIDEVHLLNEDRGPVIEVLVARTLRQVESSQSMIRIVGLSATLPNYKDIASFLKVNLQTGLFYFDASYRPVPLDQQFIGVKEKNAMRARSVMNDICYEKVLESIKAGNQVMVFVHSRKDTAKTAQQIIDIARANNTLSRFEQDKTVSDRDSYAQATKEVQKSRNKEVKELFSRGFGCHHAGMLRSDRNLVEKYFSEGYIKVLCCTATLAWGVNLPAHTVVIKGTQVYDSKAGNFVDLGMLDVMQIFGRAGRPQFDTSGEGIIITTDDKLNRYLALLNQQMPIESQFVNALPDHLNAEIVLGTVTNVREAILWLSYTYLHVRMKKNPLNYGLTFDDLLYDEELDQKRREFITIAARTLDSCRMIRFEEATGSFYSTDLGRVASHYYINHASIDTFNEKLNDSMMDAEILGMASQSQEFQNIMIREEELPELEKLANPDNGYCRIFPIQGGVENAYGKVNILLQAYLSYASIDGFALVSDSAYVVQNAGRILRGLFEMANKKGQAGMADRLLTLCKMVERRLWKDQNPLRQMPNIPSDTMYKLESRRQSLDDLREMSASEIGQLVNVPRLGVTVKKYIEQFPTIGIESNIQPITRTILRVTLTLTCEFVWNDRLHGNVEPWWIWVTDADNTFIHHTEYYLMHKLSKDEPQKVVFTIPISESLLESRQEYIIHASSDRWLGAETTVLIPFKHLVLPHQHPPHTELLNLQPLPITALQNKKFESIFRMEHFNPIQTQLFHVLYHTDNNILLGAPTGSGKTIVAEIAMLKLFRDSPQQKVVYVGPLKALVRERLKDWSHKFGKLLGKKVIELTGDYTPNVRALQEADIVLTTPEKWDGISRNWQSRSYVKGVGMVVLDEVHLLGEERGPILEVIVSRMRYISSQTDSPIRIVGLSTAMANARDLADWLGIDRLGLYNFRPSVRPVPLEAHIQGYPGKHYCPRMATMNRPAYACIKSMSPEKPTLIFVSSRRQTRLTALDLITFSSTDENGHKSWNRMEPAESENILRKIKDPNLRHTLSYGIGLHHAGLNEDDKDIIEDLFSKEKIQILISTSTLAWGVNLPAHLVVIKGTEFYDAKTKRYVDFPITDVLQMMGRAGRPQFDTLGKAVIMVESSKKNFYKKFLYEPFPVESNLHHVLHDHFNAEIISGTISSKQDAIDYLTWTFLFRRLLMNPTYYELEDTSHETINQYLSDMVDSTLEDLENAECIEIEDDGMSVVPKTLGRIASYYYLKFSTCQVFASGLVEDMELKDILEVLCNVPEYEELPVRHGEDQTNSQLAARVPWEVDSRTMDSPHTKTNLLLQSHFSRIFHENSDYVTDTKSVLDQSIRILQAMVDVCADAGYLWTTLKTMHLLQMVLQGLWFEDSNLKTLPGIDDQTVFKLKNDGIETLGQVVGMGEKKFSEILKKHMKQRDVEKVMKVVPMLPSIDVVVKCPTKISAGSEVTVKIEIFRLSKSSAATGCYAPRYPKKKDEGYWCLIGDEETGEMIALCRLRSANDKKSGATLIFDAPDMEGKYRYTLYFMCDCYLGLDQQYDLNFEVTAAEDDEVLSGEEEDDE